MAEPRTQRSGVSGRRPPLTPLRCVRGSVLLTGHSRLHLLAGQPLLKMRHRLDLGEGSPMRSFKSLSEQEVLALAISLEEEDARIYDDFADGLKDTHPAVANQFRELRAEEDSHRHRLLDLYQQKFGAHIPLIRRQDIKGFV